MESEKLIIKRTRKCYTVEEETFLKDNYIKLGLEKCAEILERGKNSLICKAGLLNIRRKRRGKFTFLNEYGKKRCAKCKIFKTMDNFHLHTSRHKQYLYSYCKQCCSIKKKDEMQNIKSDIETRRREHLRLILRCAKHRAKKKGLEFNLDLEWADKNTPEFCPILGIKLAFLQDKTSRPRDTNRYSASIDRIDNNLGYTKDNSVIISTRANNLKSNGTLEEFIRIVEFYTKLKNNKETPITY